MKRLQHSGFAKQLIIYLLTTLIITFIVISFLIINSVHTNWIILLLLSGGLIIMCIGIIYIVHHLSAPLTHLTIAIRQMADGDFKIVIPQKSQVQKSMNYMLHLFICNKNLLTILRS